MCGTCCVFAAGTIDAAMKTAIKLCEYDDILNPRFIYSLLCIAALKNGFFGTCSKAFVKVSPAGPVSSWWPRRSHAGAENTRHAHLVHFLPLSVIRVCL
jgi:hypothetical protein